MNIYVADTPPEQRITIDEAQDLRTRRDTNGGKPRQHPPNELALTYVAESELADHEWMC